MQKIWQIMPKIEQKLIEQYPEHSRVALQLLYNRGLKEKEEIEKFLNPDYEKYSHDPFLFIHMESAANLIIKHIKTQNKIVIYGDYDADGVTSSALLYEVLSILKAKVSIYIPGRVKEGYGLNKKAIEGIKKNKAKLIITVDSGIRNKENVEYAKKLGIDIIITDHHAPPEEIDLPDCLIVNPLSEGEKYPFKYLAGVGVAFKLAKAIISKAKLSEDDKKKLEELVLDLTAIGTVADCVSLTGENRILVKRGLEILNNTKRIGLQELIKIAKINRNKKLDAWNIGFQIAPRLNAAGRMDHANTAYELLITKNMEEAKSLAQRLNGRNIDRQMITDEIFEQIVLSLPEKLEDEIIIGVYPIDKKKENKIWDEGVIGLVAGKICEKYYRPALIITKTESGYKGSGRSIKEFNLIKAIEKASKFLDKFGGHPAACGFSLTEEKLKKFIEKITEVANEKLKSADLRPKIKIDTELELNEINKKLVNKIKKFEPFGQDNERPKFISRGAVIVDIINMGIDRQHIKLRLKSNKSVVINALGFGQAEKWKDLQIGNKIDIVYYMEMNEFNGRSEIQLKIIDIKSHNV